MTGVIEATVITEPGLYPDMPDDTYHGDPVPGGSLSVSGAKKLLTTCPAKFAYEREHGRAPKAEFDFGHAAHLKVLGKGARLAVIDARDYKTDKAKGEKAAAYASGQVPMLVGQIPVVDAMAAAIRRHPLASRLLAPDPAMSEQSGFWLDEQHGVWRRLRIDRMCWLGDRLVIVDYKTCESADNESCRKALRNFGYDQQDDWYTTGARALELHDEPGFLFVFQERTAPYLVNVVGCDDGAVAYGHRLNDKALSIFAECQATGVWPGYGSEITYLSLPGWVRSVED